MLHKSKIHGRAAITKPLITDNNAKDEEDLEVRHPRCVVE